jgi:hypothetical protein
MVKKELLEQKIGEAIGLEIAAQKSVEELMSKGLLKAEHEKKLMTMKEEANTQEALEFLCLAEGAEVTHYEVLSSVTKEVKSRKFGTKVRNILKEEQNHIENCTKLAKQNISKE